MNSGYSVPAHTRLLRFLLRPAFRGIISPLSQVKISGLENVPRHGAYMIAINHVSIYEAPFMLAFWPVAPEAVGAVEIWQRRGQSALARIYGGIPVHRGEYDRHLIDKMCAVLRSGRPLLIAPEGQASHTPGMHRALPGVAFVVEKADVPVVPVGIIGTTDDFFARALRGKRPTLEMRIGEPLRLPKHSNDRGTRRDTRQQNVDLIMKHIARLVPDEYRGVYADYGDAFQATQ
jgi:1-acyl-sn-glycerol-3-phosphate acyltransferase